MARAGADVCVADFDEAAAAGVADEVRGLGRRATVAGGDVGRDEARRAMVAAAERELGPIDVLVNNAGVMHVVDLFRSEEHTSELQSQSNLVCRLLLEKKKKQK